MQDFYTVLQLELQCKSLLDSLREDSGPLEKVLGKVWEQAAGEGGSKGGWVGCPKEGTETTQWAIKQCDEANGLLWSAHQPLAVSWQQATPCLELGPR